MPNLSVTLSDPKQGRGNHPNTWRNLCWEMSRGTKTPEQGRNTKPAIRMLCSRDPPNRALMLAGQDVPVRLELELSSAPLQLTTTG